ncbi:methionine synthase [Aneurinibacillus aneurinilyticus]|uniref:Methionine synthase n=1 Tax=Aneurinibacillus aneurinilyticus ATCC 12856 TaxID=649747 RepID=U1YBA8_ANEAE|nr:methionine synthase [Aneurinibacillus aneurinilyticus]ERI08091.1 5-methyltetrahydrofolate--homocysteine methyltransferase [Aneurinibacillus aneurinilyticus ATCC 12856]MED0706522.1 methionine synthase [Aneurinibacillus aneurinilyticus]MED0724413.1 methionine synthase [Aneurinibacillus aneurinilyticus]MED0730532.1 methionine synthase [Aneurinibacillus aneurinilyticus]MED0742574.1 methionine synthase [Aneurinibacillus aneurinilyticus]
MNETAIKKLPIENQLKNKILIIDGAMGTMLQQENLGPVDFGGEQYEGCNEILNLTRPDVIRGIHETYLEAGADIIETNTFGATSIVLAEYDIPERAREINLIAAKLAREAVDKYSTSEWPRYAAGAIGPTTKTLSVTGGVTFEELVESYYEQALALIEGGVDVLLLETVQDTLNVKAGGIGIQRAFEKLGYKVPVMISGTIEPMGTTLAGQNIEAFYISLEHLQPISMGLNCATGPEFMRDHIRTLSGMAGCAVSCYPNAGLPDEDGHYHESPQALATKLAGFAEQGWINVAGGCCGTTPDHIRAIAEKLKEYKPRQAQGLHTHAVSGIEPVYLEQDNRPLMVGERTNVIGSKKFRDLIKSGKYEEASEIARAQVKRGAHIIDVCLADPDRDEMQDMEAFLQFVVRKVKVPLMIDSTDPKVIALALKYSQGKAIINSINLEDGEERFAEVAPLLRKFGGAVVVGTIDEQGMAVTRERKLEVAERSYELLVGKYGLSPRDLIFDPLVFPVGTGDEAYIGSAKETVEGIRLIKEKLPECQTILGVSNVSFGLPATGREVLNAVYLYHCTKAGLDYAIVNTEKLQRFASIPEQERKMAEALLFDTTDETLAEFTAFYREKKVENVEEASSLTLEERLAHYVVEGTKEGLIPDLEEALAKYAPLDIINGPLMTGMDKVGKLFNDNQLIVAEVLQSAEVMKAAVAYLEPRMEKSETAAKGTVMLATVKGDVHDIGKNLVEIILGNNGYKIVNLGIKVPPEQLIDACRKEMPDIIGLSGLLVKSAQQMVTTAQDLKAVGIDVPILVGGAALTRKFTDNRIAPEYDGLVLYSKDAMNGLDMANKLMNPKLRDELEKTAVQAKEERQVAVATEIVDASKDSTVPERSSVSINAPVFMPPDFERHILRDYPLAHLQPYLNLRMLLGKHLGIRGNVDALLAAGDSKTVELKQIVDELLVEAKENGLLKAHGMYRFFPAQSKGNEMYIYDPDDHSKILKTFSFPRQKKEPYLCLSDFVKPAESGVMDYVAFLVVTAGQGVREKAEEWKVRGDYLRSHVLQALALELAEAFAERVHHILRDTWGFPDPAEMTMLERFGARYQGIRVSFGYPACPDLEDQKPLFDLLGPEDIGIHLTEGCMMEPEASVSALVFSHPEARYFNVGE